LELIVKTGIHDAIAMKLNENGKLTRNAIAEGIINNVRKTIIREQLTDPRFYENMSLLLDDLIRQRRDDTVAYEEFLRKAEELVRKMAEGQTLYEIPAKLQDRPEGRVIYNNLPDIMEKSAAYGLVMENGGDKEALADLAVNIDNAMREYAPAGWPGDDAREKQVLNALFPLMGRNRQATLALFELIKNMRGYQ
jgi:type I restriction enzyme R subunit